MQIEKIEKGDIKFFAEGFKKEKGICFHRMGKYQIDSCLE